MKVGSETTDIVHREMGVRRGAVGEWYHYLKHEAQPQIVSKEG